VLTVLYKEHATDAFRYALHLTGRRADAEDIVQHVFLQAHRHLESGRELVSPRAWLLTAVKHRAFNLTRDRREVPVDRPVVPVEGRESSGDEAAQLAEVRAMLWTLPEAQHHAFVLRHWSGLSQNEIADVLETTPSAVESLLGRARSALLHSHETASDACSQVRHRLLESTELGGSDMTHLGACRPCRHAHGRLARAANVAGTLSLVPGAHVAHAIAGLVPGFSAHAATSTAAAIGTTSGAGAGAGGATATWGTTTAVTTVGKAAVAAKAMAAVVAATAVVGTLPVANHVVSRLVADQSAAKSSTTRHAARHPAPQAPGATSAVGDGPPAAVIEAHGPNGHAPAQNPGKHAGAGQGLGKPPNPGGGKPAGVGGGQGNGNGLGAGGNGKAVGKPAGVGGGKPTGVGGGKPTGVGGGKPTGVGGGKPTGVGGGTGNAGGNGNGGGKPAGAGKP
jgi:RNA polymerase sigma factor (sigma-70 family)